MNNRRLILLTICWIFVVVPGLCVISFTDTESGTNTEAEQHFEKANELRKVADYDAAITEYKKAINLSPKSKIAQDAQYWIGQSYFRAGQFDAALSTFQKILDKYPASTIISSTRLMIERVQQAKKIKPFFEAVKNGDIEQVKKFVAAGADVNDRDNQSQTPLHFAARGGYEEIARLLIAEGANVNVKLVNHSWTPLLDATHNGHTKLVKLLLEKGARVDVGDDYRYTPLYYAIWNEDKDTAKLLLTEGADVNFMPRDDYLPPLHYALWNKDRDTVKLLVIHGADVNFTPKDDYPPLYYAVWYKDAELARLLVNNGAKFDVKDQDGWTAFRYAAFQGSRDMVEFFVSKGTDFSPFHLAACIGDLARVKDFVSQETKVDTKDELGWTPSFWALSTGQKEVFAYLLSQGADVTIKTNDGHTLLHQASRAGLTEIVRQLIAKGLEVDAKSDSGNTPLKIAAQAGHEEVVKLLIVNGADVNVTAKNGTHPLGGAAYGGHEEVVKLLIASGAEVNLRAKINPLSEEYRGTALHAAAAGGHSAFIDLLIANGADVNLSAISGTPLHRAAGCLSMVKDEKCAEIIKKLIDQGADVNAKSPQKGRTPLHLSVKSGRYKTARLLIAAGADVDARDKKGKTPLSMAPVNSEIYNLLRKHGARE